MQAAERELRAAERRASKAMEAYTAALERYHAALKELGEAGINPKSVPIVKGRLERVK